MIFEKNLEALLNELVNIYKSVYSDEIVKIVLYGSYARGTNQPDSDVDIVAIVKGQRQELQSKLREVWDMSWKLELKYEKIVSPTVIPYDEFEEYKEALPYYRNIEREGITLVA